MFVLCRRKARSRPMQKSDQPNYKQASISASTPDIYAYQEHTSNKRLHKQYKQVNVERVLT